MSVWPTCLRVGDNDDRRHKFSKSGNGSETSSANFEPVIIGFTCNWCSYRAADLAGTARVKYPPNVRLIRLMCSGRLDPTFVMKALADGADGVLDHRLPSRRMPLPGTKLQSPAPLPAAAPHPGRDGHRARSSQAGVGQRSRRRQAGAEISKMVEEVRQLGPLHWAGKGYTTAATPFQ